MSGKTLFISGASSGIGAATARMLDQDVKASLCCTSRGCSATTAPAASLVTRPNTSRNMVTDPVRGAPHHLRTQGKIERRHQVLKNRILLENDCLQGKLEAAIAAPVEPCDNRRYHESPGNLTPADVCSGRGPAILAERKRIRKPTIQIRRLLHQGQAA